MEVDDSAGDKDRAVTFDIFADGKLIATSPALKFGQTAYPIDVNIAGTKIVELVARTSDGTTDNLPITWGEAALLN